MAKREPWLEVCGCEIDGVNGIFRAIKGQDAYQKAGTNYIIYKSRQFWYLRDKDVIIMKSKFPNDHLVGMDWFRPELTSATKTRRPVMDSSGKRPIQLASQRDAMHKEASAADPAEQSVFRSISSVVDTSCRCEQMRRDLIHMQERADSQEKQHRATEEMLNTKLFSTVNERDAACADIRALKSHLEQLQTTGKRASEQAQRDMQVLLEQKTRQFSALQTHNVDLEKRSAQYQLQALDAQRALRDVKAQLMQEEMKSAELSAQLTSANANLKKLRKACESDINHEGQNGQLKQQLENALSTCELYRRAAEDAQRKFAAAEKVLRNTQKQRDDASVQAAEYFKQSEGLNLTLTSTTAERDQAVSQLAERSRECEELRTQAERLQQQLTALNTSTIASIDHESIVATWRYKLRVSTAEYEVLKSALREAKEELSTAATAYAQDRAKHERALQMLQGELAAAIRDRDEIQAQLQSMASNISTAEHESIVATWTDKLRVATAEINVLTGALREAQGELSAAATTCAQDRAKHESALQALQGELAAAMRDRDNIEAQLQSTVAERDAANAKSSALQQCLDAMQGQLRTVNTRTTTTAAQLEDQLQKMQETANTTLVAQQEEHDASLKAMQDSEHDTTVATLRDRLRMATAEVDVLNSSALQGVTGGELITDKVERNGVEVLPPSPPTELSAAGGASAGAGFGSVENAAGEGCIEAQSGDEGDNDPVYVENP